MEQKAKLKPDMNPIIWGIAAAIIVIALAVFLRINFGEEFTDQLFGFFWIAVSIIQLVIWYKTKNPGYFTFMLLALLMGVSYLTEYKGLFIMIPGGIAIIGYLYFIASKQMKWRFRDILELAAQNIDSTENGFTARPYPYGKIEFTKTQFLQFGKYLSKNLIAFLIEKEGGYFLLIKSSRGFWFKNPTVSKDTFVFFDPHGNVSVNITKSDYQKFKEEITFDKLCAELANLFAGFWHLYKSGEMNKILDKINRNITQ